MAQTVGELYVELGLDDSKFNSGLKGAGKAAGAAIGFVATTAGALGGAIIKAGDDSKKALNQIQAATGATADEMESYRSVMDSVVANNFGEGFEDVANSISLIEQQIDGLSPDQLQSVTENAIVMRDVFDQDINESIRGANALMEQFGLSGDEAFNLMAQGAQQGLNQNQDLADQMAEYAPLWADLGFTAEDMFNSLVNGADEGAYQIDFLNDAMKEFGIRSKDNSKASREAFEALGFDADVMTAKFAAGGETARAAFDEVNAALMSTDDAVKRNEAGVALWGTKWEDLGEDAISAMLDVKGEVANSLDALEAINEVKYDSIGDNINALKNQFSVLLSGGDIDPSMLSQTVSNLLTQATDLISTVLPTLGESLIQIMPEIISQAIQLISDNLPMLVETVMGVVPEILTMLQEQGPTLLQAGLDIIVSILSGIGDNIELVTETAITLVGELLTALVDNLPELLDAGMKILMGLIRGIIDALPELIDTALTLIPTIIETLMDFIPELAAAGVELIIALVKNLPEIIGGILKAIPEIMAALFGAFPEYVSDMADVGIDLIKGLWEGIKGMGSWIGEKIRGFFSGVLDGINQIFGVNSPSVEMKWTGEMLGLGLSDGIYSSMGYVNRASEDMTRAATPNLRSGDTTINATYQAATPNNDQVNMQDYTNRLRRVYA